MLSNLQTPGNAKRSDGYCYVETHPRSTRPVMSRSAEQFPTSRRICVLDSDQGL